MAQSRAASASVPCEATGAEFFRPSHRADETTLFAQRPLSSSRRLALA